MTPTETCSLRGDGTNEAALIREADSAQRAAAIARLDRRFPGLDIDGLLTNLGDATPKLVEIVEPAEYYSASFAAIDAILATGDLGSKRASIVSGALNRAVPIPPAASNSRHSESSPLTLDAFCGVRELRSQNTINLNDAQIRLGEENLAICDDFARAFAAHVQTNVYVSLGDAPGFGSHWDDHDVVIVPVGGAKYWDLEEPHELAPIKGVTPSGGTGKSIWRGVLRPGNALYIPRGWPHSVSGIGDECSVHLTVSIRRPTALDLVSTLPPEAFEDLDAFSFDETKYEHALGSYCSTLARIPSTGVLALANASVLGYAGWEFRAWLPGGAVFLNDRCDEDHLTLATNNHVIELQRPNVPAFAHLLEHEWTTIDEVERASSVPRSEVTTMIERLGRLGVIEGRQRAA